MANNQQHNGVATPGRSSLGSDNAVFSHRNTRDEHVVIFAQQGAREWQFFLQHERGQHFEPGHTYEADATNPFNKAGNPIQAGMEVDTYCVERTGWFTVHELELDGEVLRRFSATYSFRCRGAPGVVTGSIAYRASDPALAAPEPSGGMPTGAIGDLRVDFEIGHVYLSWKDPVDPDWVDTLVCSSAARTPAQPSPWCSAESEETTATWDRLRWASPGGYSTFTLWPRYRDGTLGSPRSVTTRGSNVSLETIPSGAGARTDLRLRGRLLDGPSRAPMAGQLVDVFLSRLRSDAEIIAVGPMREDHRVARLSTDRNGNFARTFPLRPGWEYQARFDGGEVRVGNVSQLVPADGSSYIDLDVERANAARSRAVRLAAKVAVVRRGDRVVFQRMKKGRWQKVAVRRVGASKRVVLRSRSSGAATYRAVLRSPGRTATASVPLRVRVR